MARSIATVQTEHASRYLQQLCKHWSHKMRVTFEAEAGRVEFPSGAVLAMTAEPSQLSLNIDSNDGEGLSRLESVVEEHIKRFAFREVLNFAWTGKPE